MHQASVAVSVRALAALADVLAKAQAHCEAKKIDPAVLVASRLYPDMFPLARQVQIASDSAKGGAARLAQQPVPSYEDNEASLDQLAERCRKTIGFLQSLKPEQFEGAEDRTVTWQTRSGDRSMQGLPYLLHHVIPNLYFHATTAYDILRHNGVEVGKQDFLGKA
jgi:hypothetical protein